MRMVRYGAWAVLAASVLIGVAFYFAAVRPGNVQGQFKPSIGGPFTMTTHDGKRLSDEDLKGKPFAIFFGFTYCPDICPTTLLEMTKFIEALGTDADKMRFLFVSVDPERDTPEQLKLYLSSFDSRIIGLTGTAEEVAGIAKAYRVYYEKVPQDDDYTMNHSAMIYLMDGKGEFNEVLAYRIDPQTALTKLNSLIHRES